MSARTPQQIRIELLKSALESVSIPPSVYAKAMERYRSLTEFLDNPRTQVGQWKPTMHVQGSAALGTATKRPWRQDFDFDVTLVFGSLPALAAMAARNAVEKRLREDANYARMLNTAKNRCLRLDYAKDECFHIDIVVGRSAIWVSDTGTGIQVTDRQLADWICSDPLGFIAWFEKQKQVLLKTYLAEDGRRMMINASADPAPEQPEEDEKLPLQWVIQIIKRHRDLMFLSDPTDAPISIILTTLAARAYQGEETIEAALVGITNRLLQQFDDLERQTVLNPVIPEENFADKWRTKPQRREAFFKWYGRFQADVRRFIEAMKISSISESLDSLVGERAKTRAFKAHGEVLDEMQRRGQLGVISPAATLTPVTMAGSKVIRPHTNYGSI
jgi:Cyclic GMP-AMP synthase DncV-like, nucleotidyltransferase domain